MTDYNDEARCALNIETATKAELNNALLNPLSASVLKNTSRADLVAMVETPIPEPAGYSASEKHVEAKVRAPKASTYEPKREVKKVKAGTKRAELLRALVAGATAVEIDALCRREDGTAWSKSAASAARGVFWRGLGYGSKVEGDKYFVTLPKGMKLEDCIVG